MLRFIFDTAVACATFFPRYLFGHSTEPFTAKQLDAASTWWGNFLYPDLKTSATDIKAQIQEQLYDEARGSIGLRIESESGDVSVGFCRLSRQGEKFLEIDATYPDPVSGENARKVMFLTRDGKITVADRVYNLEKKKSEDRNHAVIFADTAVSRTSSLSPAQHLCP